MASRFAADTAVTPTGDGGFRGRIDPGWWVERGPNGGYVAALILRALTATVGDPESTPRSFTVHYLAPPVEGLVEVDTVVERAGRSVTSVSGRLTQDGRLLALALAAYARSRPGLEFCERRAPDVPPVDQSRAVGVPPVPIPIQDRYETRWAIGSPPFSAGSRAESGGWIRLAEPEPVDHHVAVALADAWVPAVFSRVTDRVGVPTVDLTVHFRGPIELPAGAWCLVRFVTEVAAEGFLEEDGEIWSADGVLLAQSRQLAAVRPLPG